MNDIKKRKIIWIDNNIYDYEKQYTYKEFITSLPEYEIFRAKSVKEAFNIIEQRYDEFKFKLFYVIVGGELADEFFNEYIQKSLEMHILAATIIYCSEKDRETNRYKPYFLDTYLDPGEVTDSSYFVIDYIKKVQCPYYLEEPKTLIKPLEINEINEKKSDVDFAAEFTYVPDLGTIAFPILISKHINCTLIDGKELDLLQRENIKLYPKIKHLFKPSEEKKIDIPYHILAKYYLNIYTHNTNFYSDMNRDLRERKFDNHRIYIYLMYNGLNKGIFKSYSKSNLYRGGSLSHEEFNSLMEYYEIKKKSKSSTNQIFFFSRKFLSFSKKEEVANEFLQCAFLMNKGVYVRFVIEGIDEDDFYVSNIDINEMKLSEFNDEEEVLFLPLSCFEVISIEDEKFLGYDIKVIKLRYLNKYKKIINEHFEKIRKNNNEKELQSFIENGIHSKYSKEICKYLNNNYFIDKFLKETSRKTDVDLSYHSHFYYQFKNTNPTAKRFVVNKKYEEKIIDLPNGMELYQKAQEFTQYLNRKVSSYQFGKYNGIDSIACYNSKGELLYIDDGGKCYLSSPYSRNDAYFKQEKNLDSFKAESELIECDNLSVGKISKIVYKNKYKLGLAKAQGIPKEDIQKAIKLKENKIKYKQSRALEANAYGNVIGHFLANYDKFKNANDEDKIKILKESMVPLAVLLGKQVIKIIPVFKKKVVKNFFRNGFIIFSFMEFGRSLLEIKNSDVLTTKEKWIEVGKKGLSIATECLCSIGGEIVGMNIGLLFGWVTGPGAIIVGGLTGILFGYIAGKVNNKINERILIFYSESLYCKYVPKKYRDYAIPSMKWKDPPLNSKSYALELIINEDGKNPNWLVINIPGNIFEYNELSNEGETIIKYSGIPENAFSGCFFLYVFDIKNIDYKDFKNMKDGLEEGEKLRSHLIDTKILIII